MTAQFAEQLPLLFSWLIYGALHSALASLAVKRRVAAYRPAWMPVYRLAFNATALVSLLPVLWLLHGHPGPLLWAWSGPWAWIANGMALAAVTGFFVSLRAYDGGEFIGLRQWREDRRTVADQERFHLSPLHRFVRHPWYCFALMILWSRDMDAALLISALFATAYFVVGSRLEERKLICYHGERYLRYRDRVAGLLPLPWKFLSAAEARELVGEK